MAPLGASALGQMLEPIAPQLVIPLKNGIQSLNLTFGLIVFE